MVFAQVFLLSAYLLFGCGGGSATDAQKKPTPDIDDDDELALAPQDEEIDRRIQDILRLMNQYRSQSRLPCSNPNASRQALKLNARLQRVAINHSQDMIEREYFDHALDQDPGTQLSVRLETEGYRYLAYGENIAYGYTSPEQVMDGWINSPGHRTNLLNCLFTEMGVGPLAKKSGDQSIWYWTQVFGLPR